MTDECLADPDASDCPICGLVDLMGRKWTLHLLWVLQAEAPIRFNELDRRVDGVSPRVLSDRLDDLVEEGLVDRIDHDEVPPKVEYRLTEKGQGLEDVLEAYKEWAEAFGDGS